jgi:hypothetical protein
VQLVYVSSAAPGLTPDDLEAIADACRVRNAAAGLTGLLLHQGSAFCGVLEGPRTRLFRRMEAIITDRRHSGVRILREERVAARRFASWSFGALPAIARPDERVSPEDFIWSLARRLG